MAERVEIILLLMLLLSLYYFRAGSHGSLFVGELQGSCSVEEREALLSFKRSLFHAEQVLSNWDIANDCCTWKGVGCSNTTSHVIKLDLGQGSVNYNNNGGHIYATSLVSSLFRLKHLQYLSLSSIYFSQTSVPPSIDSLTNLKYLDLSSSGFVGVIPPHLGNLTKLQHLDLGFNEVVIDMSLDMWLFRLKQLQYLSLCEVYFKQKNILQKNASLVGLRYLDLHESGLEGVIPPHLGNLKNLRLLDLSYNSLVASNLLWMSQLSYLQYLDMSGVNLTLAINWFYEISVLPTLSILSLSRCNLQTLPTLLTNSNFSSTITSIDLSYNNLNGSLPNWLRKFRILNSLNLKSNNLTGPISKGFLSLLCNLKILDLSENNFTELIDDGSALRCKEYKMTTIDISSNQLSGSIPEWVGDRFTCLKILRLRSNKFHGFIPSELSKLKELQILDLANNFLSGPLPKSLKFLIGMTIINKRLEPLILNNGNMDRSIRNITLPNSLLIDIKGRELYFTSMLSLVMIIDLSCNNLTGEVPIELMSLIGLISLNLSRNQFTGQIPINIGVMQNLQSLDLSRNHFSGEIPASIENLSELEVINLSYNQLSGRIPTGTQLDTFNESSYSGNPKLCGKPLLKTCEGDEDNIHKGRSNSNVVDDDKFDLFLGMGLGFAVGLWSVLGTMLLKRSLAITYFRFYDNITNNIYVFVAVKMNQWLNP